MTTEHNSGATPVGGRPGESDRDLTPYETTGSRTSDRSHVGVERVESQPVRTEHVTHHETTPVATATRDHDSRPVNVAVGAERQDGVRWGPIWAGLLTALTTFLLLELAFYALGWLTLGPGVDDGDSAGLVTGILALVAFFIGGLIAGATAIWKGLFSGLLHGFLVWALGVVAFIALTFFGASALLGSFGDLTNQLGVGPQEIQSSADVSSAEADQAAKNAEDAAAPAFWGLFLPLAAAMLGGLIGSKIWPRKKDQDPETVHLRS